MIENWTDLSEFLVQDQIHSSAPARLHCGGSTDHRLAGLLCRHWEPATANIAIDLRARVRLAGYEPGMILADIEGIGESEFAAEDLPFSGPFALLSALVCFFGVHGFAVEIRTDFPSQSGLGGSGAVTIALMGAIHTALNNKVPDAADYPAFAQIAHNLEDSLFGNTGMQDQAAAVFGGANLWEWKYAEKLEFRRKRIAIAISELNEHILVAYSGRPHPQSRSGSRMLDRFKEEGALSSFVAISEQARRFASSLESGDFRSAGECLSEEFRLRSELLPVLHPEDGDLIELAEAANCGYGVTGHGGGGCIWAIGEKKCVEALRSSWAGAFRRRKIGSLLNTGATENGLEVQVRPLGTAATVRSVLND